MAGDCCSTSDLHPRKFIIEVPIYLGEMIGRRDHYELSLTKTGPFANWATRYTLRNGIHPSRICRVDPVLPHGDPCQAHT